MADASGSALARSRPRLVSLVADAWLSPAPFPVPIAKAQLAQFLNWRVQVTSEPSPSDSLIRARL